METYLRRPMRVGYRPSGCVMYLACHERANRKREGALRLASLAQGAIRLRSLRSRVEWRAVRDGFRNYLPAEGRCQHTRQRTLPRAKTHHEAVAGDAGSTIGQTMAAISGLLVWRAASVST